MSSLPESVAVFDAAQRRTIELMRAIEAQLTSGMVARDVIALSEKLAPEHGFSGWFHRPVVKIGPAIGKPPIAGMLGMGGREVAEVGSLISVDLGPADAHAYGDLGRTLVVPGAPVHELLEVARLGLVASCGYCSRWKTMGEIFIFAQAWAKNRNLDLVNHDNIGHRILPRQGWYQRPRLALWATHLRSNQLYRLNPRRMDGMFAVNPIIRKGPVAASFEEMVYVHEDTRQILGRDHLHEVGT